MNLNIELYHSNFKLQTCPNCGKTLCKISKRKFICPYCNNDIYYRTTPDAHIELLLNSQEKEVYEFYKTSLLKFNNEHSIKCMLCSELYPNDNIVNEIPKESWSSYFIPILLNKLQKELNDKDLGLYEGTIAALGYLYAMKHDYEAAFNCFAFKVHLMVHGVHNNMTSLDLRLLSTDDTYLYVDYSYLTRIFFLLNLCFPIDFEILRDRYVSIPIERKIIYRFSTQETFSKIADILKKYT